MPRQYSTQFRERVLGLVDEGRDIVELAGELEISSATIYRWRKQSKVDAGDLPYAGTPAVSQLASQTSFLRSITSKLRCPSNRVKPL